MRKVALFILSSASALAGPKVYCENTLAPRSVQAALRELQEIKRARDQRIPDFLDDLDFLKPHIEGVFSKIRSEYDRALETRVYSVPSALANAQGRVPRIDPRAEAVVLCLHGSGTMKSSGRNMSAFMWELVQLGFSPLAVDLPFHGDGPSGDVYKTRKYFLSWLKKIIEAHRVPGKPFYLMGHSFGPEVIAELVYEYPELVDGALMVSPAAYDDVTRQWYSNRTQYMKFGGDVQTNQAGSEFGEAFGKQTLWNFSPSKPHTDPTLRNPKLRLRVLSGDREEYLPAPTGGVNKTPIGPNTYDICASLRVFLARIDCTVEKGVGHYIVDFKERHTGLNVMLREMLLLHGASTDTAHLNNLRRDILGRHVPAAEELLRLFDIDPFFRQYILRDRGSEENTLKFLFELRQAQAIGTHRREEAERILENWNGDRERTPGTITRRWGALLHNIRATRITAPAFYQRNKEVIEKLGDRMRTPEEQTLVADYYDLLKLQSLEWRAGNARAHHQVYEPL